MSVTISTKTAEAALNLMAGTLQDFISGTTDLVGPDLVKKVREDSKDSDDTAYMAPLAEVYDVMWSALHGAQKRKTRKILVLPLAPLS
jgi:hypothetical protein